MIFILSASFKYLLHITIILLAHVIFHLGLLSKHAFGSHSCLCFKPNQTAHFNKFINLAHLIVFGSAKSTISLFASIYFTSTYLLLLLLTHCSLLLPTKEVFEYHLKQASIPHGQKLYQVKLASSAKHGDLGLLRFNLAYLYFCCRFILFILYL